MPDLEGLRRLGAAAVCLAGVLAAEAAAKTYPDPQAPSVPLAAWRAEPGVRTLSTEFGGHALSIPLQAVTGAFMRRGEDGQPDAVVALWIEATLPELRTVGADTLERFKQPGSPDVLWIRLHADLPPGVLDMLDRKLAAAIASGERRLLESKRWQGIDLYAQPHSDAPSMEGFYAAGARRRYVECVLAEPPGNCNVVFQQPDGVTVEYSFGLQYLEKLDWVDGQVAKLLAGFEDGGDPAVSELPGR